MDVFIGVGAGLAIAGATLALYGVGTIALQSLKGVIGVAEGLRRMTAMGFAGYNLGSLLAGWLQQIQTPEPIEKPTQIQPPVYYTPITGS